MSAFGRMTKKILIINTGGTLSSVKKETGLTPGLSGEEILDAVHLVTRDVELAIEDLFQVDSANIFPENWRTLAEKINEACGIYHGVVVLHGTDTMAYTASMLSFMLRNIPIPVVVTGSQLSISHPVADAMENCRCAIYMASGGYPGVYLAFNRKVMLACHASKVRTLSFDAFESINYPCVAEINTYGMHINKAALHIGDGGYCFNTDYDDRVFLLKLYPGIRLSVLDYIQSQGYRGLLIEGFGLGGMPFIGLDFPAKLKELAEAGIVVMGGTQCRYEGSNLSVYETGKRALRSGVIQTFNMTTEAALTKLMWVLGQTEDPVEARSLLSMDLVGEMQTPAVLY